MNNVSDECTLVLNSIRYLQGVAKDAPKEAGEILAALHLHYNASSTTVLDPMRMLIAMRAIRDTGCDWLADRLLDVYTGWQKVYPKDPVRNNIYATNASIHMWGDGQWKKLELVSAEIQVGPVPHVVHVKLPREALNAGLHRWREQIFDVSMEMQWHHEGVAALLKAHAEKIQQQFEERRDAAFREGKASDATDT